MASKNRYPGIDPRIEACIRHHACRVRGRIPGMDVEDIEQELMLRVHQRLPQHDPAQSSLRTFADRVVRNCIASLIEASQAKKRGGGIEILFLDEIALGGDDGSSPVCGEQQVVLDAERHVGYSPEAFLNLRIDLWRAYEVLPPTLRSCFLALFDNTVTDAARHSGLSRATVYDRVGAIRKRFRAVDLRAYVTEPDTFEVVPVSDQ